MPTFHYMDFEIEYIIHFKPKKKNITITISREKGVQVIAPKWISTEKVEQAVLDKASWIYNKWKYYKDCPPLPYKYFESGETFLFLGDPYTLHINVSKNCNKLLLKFDNGTFCAELPLGLTTEERRDLFNEAFKKWYIQIGTDIVHKRLDIYCTQMNVTPTKIQLKAQKRRWGTCTSRGAIYLNWRLMMAPLAVIDYVIVHELAHLKQMNHSSEFWKIVKTTLPQYQDCIRWLKTHGAYLTL